MTFIFQNNGNMKIQIRRGVFETNSSSMHAFCIVSGEELEKFKNGELNLNALYPEGEMTSLSRPNCSYRPDHIWDWEDFVNSNEDGYDMSNDIEEYGVKFPPGSIEELSNGSYKLHYQN